MSAVITQTDVNAAYAEVTTQSPEQIETATAIKWGARALAAWGLVATATDMPTYLRWYKDAVAYKHEALEHAGWALPGVLDTLKAQLVGVP